MRRTPVYRSGALIVGGGPAGGAAAIRLARAGAPHLLVERTRETGDALCGGFMSWRTLETLAGLGIAADTLNPNATSRVRLFSGDRVAETMLPRPARTVSRHRLDTLLLDAAIREGAAVERGVTVKSIDGRSAQIEGGEIAADALFLASGKHEIRGVARPVPAEVDPTLGIRVRLAASPALTRLVGDAVELHLFDRGYAGIALQEDGSANVCMAVRRSRLREAGAPIDLLRAIGTGALGDRLASLDGAAAIDAIANVPYGWRMTRGDGLYRLGDQAGVIPSLAGEGMGIAIASGVSAAQAYLAGVDPYGWQVRFARATRRPIGVADAIRHFVEAPRLAGLTVPIARALPGAIGLVARATRIGRTP